MSKEFDSINTISNEIAQLKAISDECLKSTTIYELIIICEFMNEIDINHKYFVINYPEEYKRYFRQLDKEIILCKVIKELDISGNTYCKDDRKNVLYKILGKLYYEFDGLIIENRIEYLFSIMSLLEYNRYTAHVITAWSRKNRDIKTNSNIVNVLLQILNSKEHDDRAQAYLYLDKYFAYDKNALEIVFNRIFNITHNTDLNINKQSNSCNIHNLKIDKLIELSRAILLVYSMINDFTKGDYINCDLTIQDDNYIKVPFTKKEETIRYFNHIENKYSIFDNEKIIKRFNPIIENIIGVNMEELILIYDVTAQLNKLNLDEFIIGDFEFWSSSISEKSKISIMKIKKLLLFMIFEFSNDYLSCKTTLLTKITRKSIFKINDILISPLGLFRTSLINIYYDFLNGDVDKVTIGELNMKKIDLLGKEIDEEFEEFIFNELKIKIPEAIVKKNIQQKDIKYKDEKVELPGQIDVIVLYNKNIFVIECKNTGLRTVFDKINSIKVDFQSLKKKKSFQSKLLKKIDVLNEGRNKLILANYLGDEKNQYINKPIGLIVTSDYYEINNMEEKLLPVITWTELVDRIINYVPRE